MNQLEALRQYTTVVADTGDFGNIAKYQPTDATTNPSLILKAVLQEQYQPILDRIANDFKSAPVSERIDRLLVAFGQEILKIVPGRVSTEIDARLSFDAQASIERARQIINLYEANGIARERILIKLASTWEGIQAAKTLQTENINCNLTLLFSLPQAVACAAAKVKLISPFVGRIYDWFKKMQGDHWDEQAMAGHNDPGVQSVTKIYNYYKAYDINTQIMGASFRNINQIRALAGCDLLTISPNLLDELQQSEQTLPQLLNVDSAKQNTPEWQASNEVTFRTQLNQDAMATEKLAEGIRIFTADAIKLEALIEAKQ